MDEALDAYRTCELVTLGKDGRPSAWPTSAITRPDGTILLTTSLGYPQKAFNVRTVTATGRYLAKRGWARPSVPWGAYREIRASVTSHG